MKAIIFTKHFAVKKTFGQKEKNVFLCHNNDDIAFCVNENISVVTS